MIKTYVHYSDSGDEMVVTIHSVYLGKNQFYNEVFTDKAKAEQWVAKVYRNVYADTVVHYINHRQAAFRAAGIENLEKEKAIEQLLFRFERARSISLEELVKRIHISAELLLFIQPPSESYWKAWRHQIQHLIESCHEHHHAFLRKPHKQGFPAPGSSEARHNA